VDTMAVHDATPGWRPDMQAAPMPGFRAVTGGRKKLFPRPALDPKLEQQGRGSSSPRISWFLRVLVDG